MAETSCCRCCTGFIFSLGLTALFMWLSLRPSKPTLSIEFFYLPALNKTLNDSSNNTIAFNLKFNNRNKDKGIHYDGVNISVLYYGQNLTSPVVNASIDRFYQGFEKKAHKWKLVDAVGLPLNAAKQQNTSTFRVTVNTTVRYKIIFWKTKHHRIMVGGNVTVNENGTMLKRKKKGVKLSSCVSLEASYWVHVVGLVGSVLYFL